MDSSNAILITILAIFLVVGFVTPFINAEFGTTASTIDIDSLESDIGQDDVTTIDVVKSLFTMFFWTFGALPVWLDLIFMIFRIMLAVIIFDKIWIGGG